MATLQTHSDTFETTTGAGISGGTTSSGSDTPRIVDSEHIPQLRGNARHPRASITHG